MEKQSAVLLQLRLGTRWFAIVFLALVLIGFVLPSHYRVERTIQIPSSDVQLASFLDQENNWPRWLYIEQGVLVVKQTDPMLFDIVYQAGGIGQLQVLNRSLSAIQFSVIPKPNRNKIDNRIEWHKLGEGIKVTWVIEGELEAGLLSPYLALFANQIAGKNFEMSLNNLRDSLSMGFEREIYEAR